MRVRPPARPVPARRGRRPGRRARAAALLAVLGALVGVPAALTADEPARLPSNRRFDVLPPPVDGAFAPTIAAAARELGRWRLQVAGVTIDETALQAVLDRGDPEILRAAREVLRLPVDLEDLMLFIDDVLVEGRRGLRGRRVYVPSGRARGSGLLLHPQEVFGGRPRPYGTRDYLEIDRPEPPRTYAPAEDGEILGPRWTARFANPATEELMLGELRRARPDSQIAERIESLMGQLREQGALVTLTSTVRRRERGYLMWGAFLLSRAGNAGEVSRTLGQLERANADWSLGIPIRWQHPEGWRSTIEAAREMADTYEVVYATEEGARSSQHYTGVAVDLVAIALPRTLKLRGFDGAQKTFDLSDPEASRDLSLSPRLIEWIERHFELRKLRSDYPHWDDARSQARSSRDEDPG